MTRARAIIGKARRNGQTLSFSQVAREVGLHASAVQKDAECQRLMPHGNRHAEKPAMLAAIALFEAGGITKNKAAKQCGVSSGGLVLALQRKQREKKDVDNA